MDDGDEKIVDDLVLKQVRRQARKVWTQSIIAGVILTLIVVFIPF
jgi:hypothetical protein